MTDLTSSISPTRDTRSSHVPVLALLVLAVTLAYANSLPNGFTYDDETIITGIP
jgi:hypothetical protein